MKIITLRGSVACLIGFGAAWLWLWLLMVWGMHVDAGLFRVLSKAAGFNGPWMASISTVLFSILTAFFFALAAVFIFRCIWWQCTILFVVFFWLGQLSAGIYSDTSLVYLLTHLPLWLCVACFVLSSSMFSRFSARVRPNQALKPTLLKSQQRGLT